MDVDNTKKTEESAPQPQQPGVQPELRHDELHEAREYLRENGIAIAIMVCLVLAIIVVAAVYRSRKSSNMAEAAQMMASAKTEKDFEAIVSDYGSTPYGPMAMLREAKGSFNAGDYDKADSLYSEFTKKYAKHPMAEAAKVNHFFCLEAKGQTQAALDGFTAFAAANTNHFMMAEAVFGRVRCFEKLGLLKEAQAACEDFIAANPESGWMPKANEMLAELKKKNQKQQQQATAPVAVEPAKTDTRPAK